MTGEEREHDEQGQAPVAAAPRAVVVAVDAARLDLYARTLRMAQIPSRATLDLDEAEALLTSVQPAVLVLDHGLPRLYILRLYGLVRESTDRPRVKVLFVGQDGEAGPDDYYLPGEPSPLGVASQVGDMVAEADAASAAPAPAAPAADDAPLADTAETEAADTPEPDEPSAAVGDDDRSTELVGAGVAGASVAASPDTHGGPDAHASADAHASPVAAGAIPAPPLESAPPRKRRRFDVLMFRIGMVLLILGGLLAFIRPESFTLPMSPPPTVAPAQPTPAPAASPSPAALFEDAVLGLRVSERSR